MPCFLGLISELSKITAKQQTPPTWKDFLITPSSLGGSTSSKIACTVGATVITVGIGVAVVKGWYRLKRAVGIRPSTKVQVTPAAVTNHGSRESRFAGSAEVAMPMATGQVLIGFYSGDEYITSGGGYRMDLTTGPYLVVPCHVLDEVEARGSGEVVLRGPKTDISMKLDRENIAEIITDVYVMKVQENLFPNLGVKKPKIGRIERTASAKIAGPGGKGTLGDISLQIGQVGMTYYRGTTLPGYSGCPYQVDGNIVGMHLRGSIVPDGPNIGIAARMIYITANYLLAKPEDSLEWLTDQVIKRGNKLKIDKNWGSLDSYRFQLGGDFAIVESDTIYEALGEDWLDKYTEYSDFEDRYHSKKKGKSRGESAGNEQSPGVSGLPESAQGSQSLVGQQSPPSEWKLSDGLDKLSRKQRQKLSTALKAFSAQSQTA
ncbi:hypothetical protein 1 [Hubei sobemo-like virus 44]|uniref:hypothetical protein 1 n=1 Tax=Hubei sobemo-like virus 44 TaxID=1923232 RepID=UPI000909B876|nr:hypothetical protein 1 [Hubei sobemo-like virus 44]APG75900.1 hypothetical protein 1 [Hubei sobemo-like virus 44]